MRVPVAGHRVAGSGGQPSSDSVFEEVGLTFGRRDSIADALAYEVRFQELGEVVRPQAVRSQP